LLISKRGWEIQVGVSAKVGLLDFLSNGGSDSAPANSNDATGSYLGNLIDPTTTPQYLKARQQEAALGFFTGLAAASGPSRLPVPFGTAIAGGGQGLMNALNGLSDNTLKAAQTSNQITDTQLKKLQGAGLLQKFQFIQQEMNAGTPGASAPGAGTVTPGAAGVSSDATPGAKATLGSSMTTADTNMEPEQRALLDTIAGPESHGAYNIRWGGMNPDGSLNPGQYFSDLSKHPQIKLAGPVGPSDAAGRYQFLNSTFQPIAQGRSPLRHDATRSPHQAAAEGFPG
jgi:hypothetical protein